MNTHGHHDCAKTVGEKVLKLALERAGKGAPRLTAFYLGNWFTDVSQAVDPVAYAAGEGKLQEFLGTVETLLNEIRDSKSYQLASWLGAVDDAKVAEKVEEAKNYIKEALHRLLIDGRGGRNSPLAQAMRATFKSVGYFKFVHPEGPETMSAKAYLHVFEKRYTQYYPHEHLDRPEILPSSNPPRYESSPGGSTHSKNGKVQLNPDMYGYLRDDVEIAARLFADLDYTWACKAFASGGSIDDTSDDWNLNLAKLGHALHAVEDFFAHSNFIERAALRLGEEFEPKNFKIFGNKVPIQRRETEILARRLKKLTSTYDPKKDNWDSLPEEDTIVTGYFDFQDTLVSISHILEEAFDLESMGLGDQAAKAGHAVSEHAQYPGAKWYEYQKTLTQTLELLDNPRRAWQDENNTVAQGLKEKYQADYRTLTAPRVPEQVAKELLNEPIFDQVPPEIKQAFTDAVVLLSKVHKGAKDAMSLYHAVKTIVEFLEGPVGWLKKFLEEKFGEWAKKLVFHYTEERVLDMLGQRRIGCHSLLAKDHGLEWLYEHQKRCAMAVHWYIVHVLTRWSRPCALPLSKAVCDASGEEQRNRVDQRYWIDWLELLEYFLRNPATLMKTTQTTLRLSVTKIHIVRADKIDSLANLATIYGPTAVHQPYTWERIADANFDTDGVPDDERKQIVNKILHETALGYLVKDGINYAFKPGVRVLIPDQLMEMHVNVLTGDKNVWYREVMRNETWEVFKGWEDPKAQQCQEPIEHHNIVWIGEQEMADLANGEQSLRKTAENKYHV